MAKKSPKSAARRGAAPKSSKKVTKKLSKKAAPKAKPSPKRPAPKRTAAKKPAARSAALPKTITTGRGPSAAEIGTDFVALVNLGKSDEVIGKWYHPEILSVEGDGMWWKGMKGIEEKWTWWSSNNEVHSMSAEGPFVGATGFTVRYAMSFTPKGKDRAEMTEVGVYTVQDGKIVREEYMYASGGGAA